MMTGPIWGMKWQAKAGTPNLPTNIIPTNIALVKLSGESPMGLGIPFIKSKMVLESNPLKSTMLMRRLDVTRKRVHEQAIERLPSLDVRRMSCRVVVCRMSYVVCHGMSYVVCRMSYVVCH